MKEKSLIKSESGFIHKDNQIDRGRVFLDREKNKVNSLDERLSGGGVWGRAKSYICHPLEMYQ